MKKEAKTWPGIIIALDIAGTRSDFRFNTVISVPFLEYILNYLAILALTCPTVKQPTYIKSFAREINRKYQISSARQSS
ncbi:MAG: hypothetical protein ACOYEL_05580 [Saccharofermentanales bacterium]|jgi:hypothetical protein